MSRFIRAVLIVVLLCGLLPVLPAAADVTPPLNCQEIDPDHNPSTPEVYLICLPIPQVMPPWNGDLVVFAHGYVAPNAPITQYYDQLQLADGQFLPLVANGLGYAFASTSYRKNGLAVKEGLADTVALINAFKGTHSGVRNVYLIGASEGGLITTLAAEKGAPITGGLALCGPIGNFRSQINYWGDFRVLFDYFFPALKIPTSPIDIDEFAVWPNWETLYAPQIAGAVGNPANQHLTEQLLRTSRAPIDPADPMSVMSTTVGILSYNVFATDEAILELGGQPFDNKYKWYFGSDNDWALNGRGGVQRFTTQLPLASLLDISRNYQTTGKLKVPLVPMHTLGDPIVPYWHETLYNAKTLFGGTPLKHLNIPIKRYGHCTFTTEEALAGFGILTYMATGQLPPTPTGLAPAAQDNYRALVDKFRSQLPKP